MTSASTSTSTATSLRRASSTPTRAPPRTPKQELARREALDLWRDVLRTTRAFYWARPEDGQPWSKVLRESARREFEQGKRETDPLVVARMLVVGREALEELRRRFNAMEAQIKQRVDKTRTRS